MAPYIPRHHSIYMVMHLSTTVLRFVALAPTIYYWGNAVDHDKVIRDNALLHNGTYSAAIVAGEQLASLLGIIILLWNMLIWIFSLMLPPPLNLLIAAGDTVLTVYLSLATVRQSGYAPPEMRFCRDMSPFHNQRPLGTNESFFAAAARLNETTTTPTKMCKSFVREWQYGVTLSFFYAWISLFGIAAFIGCRRLVRQRIREVHEMFECIIFVTWKGTIYFVIFLFSIPAYIFRGCLPIKAKAPFRTARQYAVKMILGVEQKTEFALKELKVDLVNKNHTIERYKGAQGESAPLAQFLGVYDMLVMVIPYLHFVDTVNLASVSKSVRNSVLPADDLYRRLALFKILTCSDAFKVPCWACSGQTCVDCQEFASVTLTIAIHHLENCQPYCMSCYYQNIALRKASNVERLKHRACKCAPVSVRSSTFNKYFRSSSRSARVPRHGERPVCRACSTRTAEEMTLRKDESAKVMLKKGQKSDGRKWNTCAREGCAKRLGAGPRFWVCTSSFCRWECTSNLHQAWGTDSKGTEDTVQV